MTRSFTLPSRAKINTVLHVGKRLPNGYHRIETTFQEISLSDFLRFEPAPKIQIQCSDRKVPLGRANLIFRALELLKSELGVQTGIRVTLKKNIPMGAGLGGGSSNAAAALKGGWRMWTGRAWKRPPAVVQRIAKTCGADVPFFLKGGRASAGGIGEKLRAAPPSRTRWFVIVYPGVHVSTKKAYGWIDQSRKNGRSSAPRGRWFNSFESVVLPRFPRIRHAKEALARAGCAPVLLSGSGSAVFGVASSRKKGERIRRQLARIFSMVFLCRSVS